MSGTALGKQVQLAFYAAIGLILVLGALGINASWVPTLLGALLVDLIWDAVLGVLAGALAQALFGWSFRLLGVSAAAVTQVIQWILAAKLQ